LHAQVANNKTRSGQKTRDSLKQHKHKQKAPAHQTITRNYKLQHTGVLHLQVTRQFSTIIQIATYRALSLQLKKELQNHEKNGNIQDITMATYMELHLQTNDNRIATYKRIATQIAT